MADARPLADLRHEYALAGLDEADVAPTWLTQFERWMAEALAGDVLEPTAMVFSTASADGDPSSRTVLLKGVDERGFVLYTNRGSRKGRDAAENPRADLLFPWYALQRQVVVHGAVARVEEADSDAYFASRPLGSQLSAAASPQGAVVASRADLVARRDALVAEVGDGVAPARPPVWGGLRVVPDAVEFWQGRPDRLHDRLRFTRGAGGAWSVERVAP